MQDRQKYSGMISRRRKHYRELLWGLFAAGTALLGVYTFCFFYSRIPDEIRLNRSEEQEFDWNIPVSASFSETSVYENEEAKGRTIHVDMAKPFSVVGNSRGSYVMDCKLFGLIPLKQVSVNVVEKEYVTPGGCSIGIYLRTNGVLAIGTSPITSVDGTEQEPARNIVRSGDYIEYVDGALLKDKEALVTAVSDCGGKSLVLGIRREGETMELRVTPVLGKDGMYRLGIWVRDNTQGIGTLTYVDEEGGFGALGHGINDVDTSTLMEIESGSLYEANILSLTRGEKGSPGVLLGMSSYEKDKVRGEILAYTQAGIFGVAQEELLLACAEEPVEIGRKQEIVPGPAVIRCSVENDLKEYEVEIEEIHLSGDNVNKGIVLRVTDEELLEKTGGIVQGLSGSPIIQNGKLIGAVTHVFVQDPTKGFGIFIENMLEH